MNPLIKLHLGSAGYCALLVSLNWFWSAEYSRQFGVTSESVTPFALALLLSAGVAVYLAYRCVRATRRRLERGTKVKRGRWIPSRSVVLYALPLLFRRSSGSTWTEADGALATASGGYGHPSSTWVFLFAVLGLFLFQILVRLSTDDDESEPQTASAVVAGHRSC